MNENKIRGIVLTAVITVGALLSIGAWYNNTHYNSTIKNNFITACEDNSSASMCDCSYGVLQSEYSYSQAKYMDANPQSPESQGFYSDAIGQCE